MDQVKIGNFIAERRKSLNLTQMQLAEKLNITDRAVSKWETGLAMPNTSIMLDLCGILQISTDELLKGELASTNNVTVKLDKKTSNLSQNKTSFWILKSIPVIFGLLAFILSFFTNGAILRLYEVYLFDIHGAGCVRLISFFFGGGEVFSLRNEKLGELDQLSGISLFGVIALICLIIAFVFFIIHVCTKKDKFYITSCILFILSGIFILFLRVIGTTLNGRGWGGFTFTEGFDCLAPGTIIWCFLCVFGGVFGLFNHFVVMRKN